MPRSIWNGTITFGLIAVPIKVHSATEDNGVHFHQVHAKDGAQIKQKRVCSKEGKEVPYKEVAKGYGRLLQLYAVHKATREARKKGHFVSRSTKQDGSIKLVIACV